MNESKLNPFAMKSAIKLDLIVRDCFGRGLDLDDEILVQVRDPIRFRLASVNPVLDPAQPPNLIDAHLMSIFTLRLKRDTAIHELMRVRTAGEAGPSGYLLRTERKEES